jgi:hypothetical protein
MRGASADVSVIGVSPFLCCSAQTEEGKNGHDDHDKTNEVDDAVHDFLHECDGLSTGVASRRSTLSGQCRFYGISKGRASSVRQRHSVLDSVRKKSDPKGPLSLLE